MVCGCVRRFVSLSNFVVPTVAKTAMGQASQGAGLGWGRGGLERDSRALDSRARLEELEGGRLERERKVWTLEMARCATQLWRRSFHKLILIGRLASEKTHTHTPQNSTKNVTTFDMSTYEVYANRKRRILYWRVHAADDIHIPTLHENCSIVLEGAILPSSPIDETPDYTTRAKVDEDGNADIIHVEAFSVGRGELMNDVEEKKTTFDCG